GEDSSDKEDNHDLPLSWHGTLLPKTDADIWLATAFANYHKIVALEKSLRRKGDGTLSQADQEQLAVARNAYRSEFLAASRPASDVPLTQTRSQLGQDYWYRLAAGKGLWVLQELRQLLGDDAFDEIMDKFGRINAGEEVTTDQFRAHVERAAGQS